MKILKTIGISLLVLIVLFCVVALFLPSQVHVERSVVMKAEPSVIFEQVNTLKNWEKWSPWHHIDPNMKLTYEGPASGQGAKYIWSSDNSKVGKGSLWITDSRPDSMVANNMQFDGMGTSVSNFKIEKTADGTKVTWGMDSKSENMPFFMRLPSRYFNLMMDGMVGPDFEKGLNNMKDIAEKMPAAMTLPDVKPEEVTTEDQKTISVKITCAKNEIGEKFGSAVKNLSNYATKKHAKIVGSPFGVYHEWKDKYVFDAGICIDKKIPSEKDITYNEMKSGKALKVDYQGSYMKMEPTYMSIEKWMKENNKKAIGDAWEVYVTGPMQEKDTSKWMTQIYYPM